jgi:GT2 family glycosyltransferase/glycosyltransferase involved in cell wall biosynthesis
MSDPPARGAGAGMRILRGVIPFLLSPLLIVLAAVSLALCDLVSLWKRRSLPKDVQPDVKAATIVIPNWNGRDLLAKYLASVIAAAERVPGSEILVVDNGSEDGSVAIVREHFPQVMVLPQQKNLGFGGGSNAGFRAATHDVVVLLNSDMRVEPDFLQPLLDGFRDPQVFSVTCQIFFSDPNKVREETGLTETWWQGGAIRVRHRNDPEIRGLFPCAYGGGGSCAFDRRKFLELGGFDELLAPFYMEDTDLGYLAWKRGWKNLYQPASVVYHEHRGTIGKRFSNAYIQGVLQKNFLLFTWKNIHDWRRLGSHFVFAWWGALFSWVGGESPERGSFMGILRAVRQLPHAMTARVRARGLAVISDTEALRRPSGGYFRDAFAAMSHAPPRLRVLFASPYPIYPPVHGGAVFMSQTVKELARLCELHALVMLDDASQREAHRELDELCATTDYLVRSDHKQKALASLEPHALREFRSAEFAWMIHRQIYTQEIDVLQLEYTVLGQYAGRFRRIPSILFEHDVYFQSIARRLPFLKSPLEEIQARWEYLRALRYELRLLPKMDRIQVCSRDNAEYLLSFLPALEGRIDDGYRAGIDTSQYCFSSRGRTPLTILFLGSFRHLPNQEALQWFTNGVLPLILKEEPAARFVVIGSDPPPQHSLHPAESIDLIGFVNDIREPLAQYAVFVCPILSGSGVRVKLLEAFAAGIPVVSTHLGAEGLADQDGEICALADDPESFARRVLDLLGDSEKAAAMAARARAEVIAKRDIRKMTERMVDCYRSEVMRLRSQTNSEHATANEAVQNESIYP